MIKLELGINWKILFYIINIAVKNFKISFFFFFLGFFKGLLQDVNRLVQTLSSASITNLVSLALSPQHFDVSSLICLHFAFINLVGGIRGLERNLLSSWASSGGMITLEALHKSIFTLHSKIPYLQNTQAGGCQVTLAPAGFHGNNPTASRKLVQFPFVSRWLLSHYLPVWTLLF